MYFLYNRQGSKRLKQEQLRKGFVVNGTGFYVVNKGQIRLSCNEKKNTRGWVKDKLMQ